MTHEPVPETIGTIRESFPSVPRRASKKRSLSLLLALFAGAGAFAIWQFYNAPAAKPPASPGRMSPPVAVTAARAEKADVPIVLNGLGTVVPLISTSVRTQISGRLTEVAFKEGDHVKAGDFLAEVDPRPYEFALKQYEGQLHRDRALLQGAEKDFDRYTGLAARGGASRQQVDSAEALVGQYRGAVMLDEAQVETAKLNVAYCHIVAPTSGRLGLRQVDLGNYVQANDTNGIVIITQLQPITVVFTVPQDHLPALMSRIRAGAKLQVVAFDRHGTAELETGELAAVDNQIDPSTGTIKLKASFANEREVLFPNQFVNARLLLDVLKDTITVPRAAIQHGAPGTFVYVITPNSTVSVRPVTPGPVAGERAAILAGLEAGESVVIDGADKLREGARIVQPGLAPKPKGNNEPPPKDKGA